LNIITLRRKRPLPNLQKKKKLKSDTMGAEMPLFYYA
jgi:hypothetical protein